MWARKEGANMGNEKERSPTLWGQTASWDRDGSSTLSKPQRS